LPTLSAYPVGILADRMDRITILIIGLTLLVLADLVLAFSPGIMGIGIDVMLWGLHMGFTQGLFATLVADAVRSELRGTAFGMFNLVTGFAMLLASVIAGALWGVAGPQGTFLAGGGFALMATGGLLSFRGRLRNSA